MSQVVCTLHFFCILAHCDFLYTYVLRNGAFGIHGLANFLRSIIAKNQMSNLAPPSFHSNLATVSIWHLLTNISNHPVFHRIQRSGLEQPLEQYIDSVSTKLTSFWFLKKRRSRRKKCIKEMAQITTLSNFLGLPPTIVLLSQDIIFVPQRGIILNTSSLA